MDQEHIADDIAALLDSLKTALAVSKAGQSKTPAVSTAALPNLMEARDDVPDQRSLRRFLLMA